MAQEYVQLPTKDELKAVLSAKLKAGDINKTQVNAAVEQYKQDLKTHGPPLSPDQITEVEAKADSTANKLFRGTIASLFGAAPTVDVAQQDELLANFRGDTRNDLIKAEQFRMTNPVQAAIIDEMSPLESFMVGTGGGVVKLGRGLTGQKTPEDEQQALEQLKTARPSAVAGELVGETAPFAIPGAQLAKIASLPIRGTLATGLGATEGFALARGEEKDAGKGALVGAGVSASLELGIPVVGRLGGSLFRKLTGKAPSSPIISETGEYSEEFLSTIGDNGLTPDDFMADVQSVISGQGNDELANAVADTATAIKSQSGRDLKAIAASPDIDPAVLASAERLGVAADLPISVMSKNAKFKDLEMGLSSIVSGDTGARVTNATEIMMDKADETIELLGGTTKDSGALTQRVYGQIDSNLNSLQSQSNELYDIISKAVPPETAISDISPLQDYMREQLKNKANQRNQLSKLDKDLITNLMGTEDKGVIVTYSMIDEMRKNIGEQLARQSTPFPDASQAQLSKAYSMLTDLQANALKSMDASKLPGGDAKPLIDIWQQGKDLVSQRKQIEESLVENFGKNFGTNIIPTLEAGLFKLPKDGTEKFVKAINAIPEELRAESIATSLNKVFTGGSGQSKLNMGGFSQWWNKLNRNETAKNELFKHLPKEGQQRIEDLAIVSDGFRKALLHKKDTGRVQTLFDNFDKPNGLLDRLYYGGGGVDPGTSAVVQVVKNAANKEKQNLAMTADRLLASPSFKQMVISASDDPSSALAQKQLRALTESKVYNQWVDELPRNARVQVLSAGIIPFLLGDEQEETE